MIPVPVTDSSASVDSQGKAEAAARKAIDAYGSRWVLLMPILMVWVLGGLCGYVLSEESASKGTFALLAAGLLAFALAWWGAVWLYPTMRYRMLCKKGQIIEVYGDDAMAFRKAYYEAIRARNIEQAVRDEALLREALLEVAKLNRTTVTGLHLRQAVISRVLLAARAFGSPPPPSERD